MDWREGSGCRVKWDITRVQMERNIRRATESKGPSLRKGDSLIAPPDRVSQTWRQEQVADGCWIPRLRANGEHLGWELVGAKVERVSWRKGHPQSRENSIIGIKEGAGERRRGRRRRRRAKRMERHRGRREIG